MAPFRLFLLVCLVAIAGYTSIVIAHYGMDFLPLFFADIAGLTWRGQFNVDFTCFLALSALWVSWRHQFSPAGLALGLIAFFGGMLFLSIYLLIYTGRTGGNIAVLLLGEARAAG